MAQIKNLLRGQPRFRDLLLFTVGINTALRISDLLLLRIGDFIDDDREVRKQFRIREQKRDKRYEVVINDSMREALYEYRAAYPEVKENLNHFVFLNTRTKDYARPISRVRAQKFIASIYQDVDLRGNYGTHTVRKTWSYYGRMSGVT